MPPSSLFPVTAAAAVAAQRSVVRLQCCRFYSKNAPKANAHDQDSDSDSTVAQTPSIDVAELLKRPTWSVRSLLPDTGASGDAPDEISPAQLRHLLRLSALPRPSSPADEAAHLATLRTQLNFVRSIQSVDTTGLPPLQAIRDETRAGCEEQTIGIKTVEHILLQEEAFGHNRRPRRIRTSTEDTADAEDWDVLSTATRKAGRYIVVDGVEK